MKKMTALILALALLVFSLAGCSSNNSSSASGDDGDKVYRIGICQPLEHPALDAATKGFQDALTEALGDKVEFENKNAQGEQANIPTIINGFVSDKVDLILANATQPLQAAANATNDIPILGTSITDYASALDISDWSGATGRNISGTSDCAPLDQQEDMLVEMFPDAKNVGIVYCSSESNSKYQADVFTKELEKDGLTATPYTISDSNDIQSVLPTACQNSDVLYIPTDNTLASNTEAVKKIAVPAGTPIICGEEGICKGCGVATLSISYYDLGYKTGKMAYEILVNGADISTMDVQYADKVTKEYNEEICNTLGITPPEGYTAISNDQ